MANLLKKGTLGLLAFAVAGVVGNYASSNIDEVVENNVIQDVVVSLAWIIAISLPWALALIVHGRGPLLVIGAQAELTGRPVHLLAQGQSYDDLLTTVTGDSKISEVTVPWCPVEEVRIYDFYDLTLAQMALLRRISILPGLTAAQGACEEVLIAAGVDPAKSLVRMRGLGMFSVVGRSDQRVLSQKGLDSAHQFSIWLTYDMRLVAAYRKVTYQIDRTIRFDGKALLYEAIDPPAWVVPSISSEPE